MDDDVVTALVSGAQSGDALVEYEVGLRVQLELEVGLTASISRWLLNLDNAPLGGELGRAVPVEDLAK